MDNRSQINMTNKIKEFARKISEEEAKRRVLHQERIVLICAFAFIAMSVAALILAGLYQ